MKNIIIWTKFDCKKSRILVLLIWFYLNHILAIQADEVALIKFKKIDFIFK